jgi:predicted secreted Zn-dependent protease
MVLFRHSCAALALLALPASAGNPVVPERVAPIAGVTVPTTFQAWTLTAATVADVELHQFHGPCGRLACTEWSIDPKFSFEPFGAECRVTTVTVQVSVNYRLPDWQPSRPPPPDMQAFWRREEPRILEHEGGHRDLAVDTANRVHAELSALPSGPTCKELVGRAQGLALRLIGEGEQRQRDYDANTEERYRHTRR